MTINVKHLLLMAAAAIISTPSQSREPTGLGLDRASGKWTMQDRDGKAKNCPIVLTKVYNERNQGYDVSVGDGCMPILGGRAITWRTTEESIYLGIVRPGSARPVFIKLDSPDDGPRKYALFTDGKVILRR